ncbi:zinc ribbon domain-containing protein, partial [Micromonospora sp. ATA51]|uniref:zinc ribbon domain-containing protein n=1 Tax=Micromonospora sp. ATA51 TaxID=2806098 RepID=UPI001A502FA5|nr:transposase [Micromonospora sp. ATA51]
MRLVDERGTSSTCPACGRRVPKPRGRTLSCPHCGFSGHRDLVAAASIATRVPGGGSTTPAVVVLPEVVTHRRAGRTCPVPDGPDVTPAAHPGRREDQLARGGPPHHPVGSRSPNRRGSTTPTA